MGVVLSLKNISVKFGGFTAIDNFSLDIKRGGLRFIIGPNGAGKTTLLDVICGKVKAVSGSVSYDVGSHLLEISNKKIEDIALIGITRKFQVPSIFENLTIIENVELALQVRHGLFKQLLSDHISYEETQKIEEVLQVTNLSEHRHQRAGILPHGKKQWLEIAMAIVNDPKVLLVDEPIAGMTGKEREATGNLLKRIGEKSTVVIVEHDMNFVDSYADEVIVMHGGKLLCSGTFEEINSNPQVKEVYLGR